MSLKVKFSHSDYSDKQLSDSIDRLLRDNKLCSMATIKDGEEAYVNTAYFVYNKLLEFYILTEPSTQHSQNTEINGSVALAIYDSHQIWGNNLKGLQIVGQCKRAKGLKLVEGTALYLKRFSDFGQWIKHPDDFAKGIINSKIYIIKTNWMKLFDEESFGKENYIVLGY